MLVPILLAVVLALACADVSRRRKYRIPKGFKLPPGPEGKPIVGHFFELSDVFNPELMREWRKTYGDIVSINTLGIPIVFIYSDKIARDLFEKHGATYSDRPAFHMEFTLGWDYNIGLFPYGVWWRRHIRIMNQYFNSRAVSIFEPVQMKSRRLLLRDLLLTPNDFEDHIKLCIGRVIVDTMYAIDIKSNKDAFIENVHIALEGFGHAGLPGIWLMDIFPMLKCIPTWIPGLTVNKLIKKYTKATRDVADIPFSIVQKRTESDHSFVSISLKRLRDLKDPLPDKETVIKNTAGIAYAAGAGTSYSVFLQALVASLLFPETQKKMQDELDQVLGDRLPTLKDRIDLPYTNAFCHEVMRWRPSLPLGVSHATLENDVYGKYFIPKGSIVIADSWQVLRDEKYGPNPENFDPERFFQPGIRFPNEQFGFGRRMCPGRFFANNTFFLLVASIFKVFKVKPMKDENGIDIPISDETTVSMLPSPLPFRCSFTPRSPRAKDLVLAEDI